MVKNISFLLGAPVSSLVYVPETLDGIVEIGNDGAVVKFLVRPSLNSLGWC